MTSPEQDTGQRQIADSVAQSNVDVILHCLATPPDEHQMETEEEWWFPEVGERAAMYVGFTMLDPETAFMSALMAWDYRRNPARYDGGDGA